jgi:hypothetical protein
MSVTIHKSGGLTLRVTNNIPKFTNLFRFNQHRTLKVIGKFVKNKMDYYVAVDTGYLKSRNRYKVTIFGKNLIMGNDCYYAVYQEFGTSNPNYTYTPFIRPAVYNHIPEINRIAGRELASGIK